jgi:putative ABC transport system permease protein
MSLFGIAWRSIRQRALASFLTALSMGLGVMLVVAVLSIHGVVSESFRSNASLGYNMLVGAKGGKLQLTLNTVYYLSQPVENIPYEYYLEFLTAEQRQREQADPGRIDLKRAGRFGSSVTLAIPVCLGDYVEQFRLVGTTPALLDQLRFGPDMDRKFEFAAGRNFQHKSAEHGYFEAVLGAVAARELGVDLGAELHPAHGDPEGHSHT